MNSNFNPQNNKEIKKYSCFFSNIIFIIPHDLYDSSFNDEKSNILENSLHHKSKNIKTKIKNYSCFKYLNIISVLNENWEEEIKKTINSSKIKILQKLGIN
jgi:hypothetical protein